MPPDLDFVARRTLREQGGPQTPGELVEQIGPWSPTPVGAGLEVQTVRPLPGNRTEPLDRDRATGGVTDRRPHVPAEGFGERASEHP